MLAAMIILLESDQDINRKLNFDWMYSQPTNRQY